MFRGDEGSNSLKRMRYPGPGRWTKIMMMVVVEGGVDYLF
jgi:hypothetical protein